MESLARVFSQTRDRITLSKEEALARRAVSDDGSGLPEREVFKLVSLASDPMNGLRIRAFLWRSVEESVGKKWKKLEKSLKVLLMIFAACSAEILDEAFAKSSLISQLASNGSVSKATKSAEIASQLQLLLLQKKLKFAQILSDKTPKSILQSHVLQFNKRLVEKNFFFDSKFEKSNLDFVSLISKSSKNDDRIFSDFTTLPNNKYGPQKNRVSSYKEMVDVAYKPL